MTRTTFFIFNGFVRHCKMGGKSKGNIRNIERKKETKKGTEATTETNRYKEDNNATRMSLYGAAT